MTGKKIETGKAAARPANGWKQRKRQLRARAQAGRSKQPSKDSSSRHICQRLAELPEYDAAATVLFYVDFGAEVRTRHFFPSVWRQGKQLVVPYCIGDRLELFRLRSLDELVPGTWQIPEPAAELRGLPDRKVGISQVDLVVVPGVAFDRRSGRLGHGKGYYDKLLRAARPETTFVALAFECQLFDEVPMLPHDVYMDKVITEKTIYER